MGNGEEGSQSSVTVCVLVSSVDSLAGGVVSSHGDLPLARLGCEALFEENSKV